MVSKISDVSCTARTIAEKIFLVYYFTASSYIFTCLIKYTNFSGTSRSSRSCAKELILPTSDDGQLLYYDDDHWLWMRSMLNSPSSRYCHLARRRLPRTSNLQAKPKLVKISPPFQLQGLKDILGTPLRGGLIIRRGMNYLSSYSGQENLVLIE